MLIVVYLDLRFMWIPNVLVLVFLGLFLVAVPLDLSWGDLLWRILAAAVAFALCLGAFALRVMGGGDAKLLPVLILFVPSSALALFCLLLSVGIVMTLVALPIARRATGRDGSDWVTLSTRNKMPFGVPMGLAVWGLFVIGVLP